LEKKKENIYDCTEWFIALHSHRTETSSIRLSKMETKILKFIF